MKNREKRNFWLLGVGIILFATFLGTPALADSGQFTGCLGIKTQNGQLYNIQAGDSPTSICLKGDVEISFYDANTVNTLKENEFALQTKVNELQENVNTLQADVSTLKDNETKLQTQVNELQGNVSILQSILQGVTHTGNEIYITGANLHILSGSGSTEGPVNGLGNLIIGYNENRSGGNFKTGSHNLILGKENNYMSYGGLITGWHNEISNKYASVTGGQWNTASGAFSSITGGGSNTASGYWSSVSGGNYNTARGSLSSISGGNYNLVTGSSASVSGGSHNTASGFSSSVSGGYGNNNATGNYNWTAGSTGTLYTGQFFSNQ